MTIKEFRVQSAEEAFRTLEELSLSGAASIFRGHRSSTWRLESTFGRHRSAPFSSYQALDLDGMILHFIVRLRSMNLDIPFDINNRRARLEFARHYRVPSPLIDFSVSPYVAMFFAFNGVQPSKAKETDYATIHCVDVHELASLWAVQNSRNVFGDTDGPSHNKLFGEFMIDYEGLFEKEYPSGILKYISLPAS